MRHDLVADPPLDADLHLFHRIDTEFDNRGWQRVFERFASVPVLFAAAGQVDLRGAFAEWRKGRRPGASRAGWVRTRPAIEGFGSERTKPTPVNLGDLPGWELEPKLASFRA